MARWSGVASLVGLAWMWASCGSPPASEIGTAQEMLSGTEACPEVPACGPQAPHRAVHPILECVVENADGTYRASFGYRNRNACAVELPVGHSRHTFNGFVPSPIDRGQPARFCPGRHHAVFSVGFEQEVSWVLRGRGIHGRAVATRRSHRCWDNRLPETGYRQGLRFLEGPSAAAPACLGSGEVSYTLSGRIQARPGVDAVSVIAATSVGPPTEVGQITRDDFSGCHGRRTASFSVNTTVPAGTSTLTLCLVPHALRSIPFATLCAEVELPPLPESQLSISFTHTGPVSVEKGGEARVGVMATGSESRITWSLDTSAPPYATLDPGQDNGAVTVVLSPGPDAPAGLVRVTVLARDAQCGSASSTLEVTVVEPPSVPPPPPSGPCPPETQTCATCDMITLEPGLILINDPTLASGSISSITVNGAPPVADRVSRLDPGGPIILDRRPDPLISFDGDGDLNLGCCNVIVVVDKSGAEHTYTLHLPQYGDC